MNLYALYSIKHNTTVIDQVEDFTTNMNLSALARSADGVIDPAFAATIGGAPVIGFSTSAIESALTLAGIGGLAIAPAASLVCALRKRLAGGIYAGAASHMTLTAANGLLIPRTLSADQSGVATISYEAHLFSSDGTTAPFVIATTATLADTQLFDELFTVGPVNINGGAIDTVQSIAIDFGLEVIVRATKGLLWPLGAYVAARNPSIRITSYDPTLLSTPIGQVGIDISSDVVIYLRGIQAGVGPYANASEQHLEFTVADGRVSMGPISVAQGADAGVEIIVTPTTPDTTAIIAVAANQAIT